MPPKKKIAALVKVQLQAGAATPAPPGRYRPRSPRREHHGLLQGLQRPDGVDARQRDPGRDHHLRRPFVHVHHQDPARSRADQEGGRSAEGVRRPAQGEGRSADQGPGPRDRHDQDARPQRQRHRRRDEDRRGHRPLDGRHDRVDPPLGPRRATDQATRGRAALARRPHSGGRGTSHAAQQDLPRRGGDVRPGRALRSARPRSRSPRTPARRSSTRPSTSSCASGSTPARPTRWCAAPSTCLTAPARPLACSCSRTPRRPTPPARPAPTWSVATS